MARTLQVRDVPEDIHAELRDRAAGLGMSLSDYLLHALTDLALRPAVSDTLRRSAERGNAPGLAGQDVVEIIRRVETAGDRRRCVGRGERADGPRRNLDTKRHNEEEKWTSGIKCATLGARRWKTREEKEEGVWRPPV